MVLHTALLLNMVLLLYTLLRRALCMVLHQQLG
jgi:hypothetical protein